jgi:hypothetical protein
MPFLSFLLKVVPLEKDKAQAKCGPSCVHLSNAVSRILVRSGEAGTTQHHWNDVGLHVTVALLASDGGQHSARVTVCGLCAFTAVRVLLSALAEQPLLRCGCRTYQVLSVDLAGTSLTSVCTWADLLASPSSEPDLRLRFVTPAVFAVAEGSMPAGVFPQPLQVFSSLLERWSQLGGPALARELIAWLQRYECVVSDYWLKARSIGVSTGAGAVSVYPGWTGWITYICREPQSPYMSALKALARLACFTGVGDYTEVGLGVTQIVENE